MTIEPGSIDHLSQVISQVVAPSFLLGAVASFISILFTRMTAVIDRIRSLNSVPERGHDRTRLRADLPRLRRRAKLLNRAILVTIASGAATTILIIFAFASALAGFQHVWLAAILFIISLSLLCVSLALFAADVVIALNDFDHYS